MSKRVLHGVLALATLVLGGCAGSPDRVILPQPLVSGHAATQTAASLAYEQEDAGRPDRSLGQGLSVSSTPPLPDISHGPRLAGEAEDLPAGLPDTAMEVNIGGLGISAFADEVLGRQLGLNVVTDPALSERKDLLTLQTGDPVSAATLFRLSRQVLGDYGVQVRVEGEIVRLTPLAPGTSAESPLLLSGRALPDVPATHRPVYFLLELKSIRVNEASRWLRAIYGTSLETEESTERNALLIKGRAEEVRQAAEAVRVFDRPYMKSRHAARLEPAFMSAEDLASKLADVLTAEGIGASRVFGVPAAVLLLPISAVNTVVVFAGEQSILDHTVAWAKQLDQPNPAVAGDSLFYYEVKNTRATDIAAILGGGQGLPTRPDDAQTAEGGTTAALQASNFNGRQLLVDGGRNALIFRGDPAEWQRMLPLVRQMDRAARQVMVEVTIAEVSLDDNEEFGVSWLANAGFDRFGGTATFGSLPAAGGGGGSGFAYLLDVAGQSRALLRALADDQRVSILSTPRLMVRSGEEASIDVGTEVPIITARTTSAQQSDGNSALLQSIQYRKTGIILRIKPTAYSDDQIDLDIEQEVSEALPLGEGNSVGSPSIFNRSVQTSLSLRDGGSVVLAGLMSQRETNSDAGIPGLKSVPVLGRLFSSRSKRRNKTELVVMIVPYIVGNDQRAAALTEEITRRLELIEIPDVVPVDDDSK